MGFLRKTLKGALKPLGPVGKGLGKVVDGVLDVGSAVVNPVGKPIEKAIRKTFKAKKRETVTVITAPNAVIVKASDLPRATVTESSFAAVRISLSDGDAAVALGRAVPALAGAAAIHICTCMQEEGDFMEAVVSVDIQVGDATLLCGAVIATRDAPASRSFTVQGTLLQCNVHLPPLLDTAGRSRGVTAADATVILSHLETAARAHVAANPVTCGLIAI